MKYSFISTSQGKRESFFSDFLYSLEMNTSLDKNEFEVIYVDQTNGEYDDIISSTTINILKLDSEKTSLSNARNMALSHATGEYILLSDDDADYSKFDFSLLNILIEKHTIISFPVTLKPDGTKNYGNRKFPSKEKNFNVSNIFSLCLSLSVAIPKNIIASVGYFDTQYGAGAKYGGSEETDLLLKLYSKGIKIFYTNKLNVMHPLEYTNISKDENCNKFHRYAIGYSKICKKNIISTRGISLIELARVISRTLVSILIKKEKKLYWFKLKGFLYGLFL